MATVLDVITRALIKSRVVGMGKTPKANEAADGLVELNNMLGEWANDGIDLALPDLISTDDLDLPTDHLSAITLSLAARLGGAYGAELSPADIASLERGMGALRAYHFSIASIGIDHPLAISRTIT